MADSATAGSSNSERASTETPASPELENPDKVETNLFAEPEVKKRKISKANESKAEKLEQRLGGILCCAVCLDLPRAAVYQVSHSLTPFAPFTPFDPFDPSVAITQSAD